MKSPFKLPHKIEDRNRIVSLWIGLALAAFVSIVYAVGLLKGLDNFDLDQQFGARMAAKQKPKLNKDIVFIEIDDETLTWEKAFPDDPVYYKTIIEGLGPEKGNARSLYFDIHYSQPFGRKVDPYYASGFPNTLDQVVGILRNDAQVKEEMLGNLQYFGELLAGPGGHAYATDLGARVEEYVYSEEGLDASAEQIGAVAQYFEAQADLSDLAQNREATVSGAMENGAPVHLPFASLGHIPSPYGRERLKNDPRVRSVLEKVVMYPTRNRPSIPQEGQVYDAYQNLRPADFDYLLEGGTFKGDVAKRIERDGLEKKETTRVFEEQNAKWTIDIPKGLENYFPKFNRVAPPLPEIAKNLKAQGFNKPEFSSNGTLYKISPLAEYNGKLHPHADLILAMDYLGVPKKKLKVQKGKLVLQGARAPGWKAAQDVVVPLDENGAMFINWTGIWADTTLFPHYNLFRTYVALERLPILRAFEAIQKAEGEEYDALNQEFSDRTGIPYDVYDLWKKSGAAERKAIETQYLEERGESLADYLDAVAFLTNDEERKEVETIYERFRDKIVFIGLTAVGAAELIPNPLEPRYHIVGMHANAVNTIVERQFIRKIPAWGGVAILFLLAVPLAFVSGSLRHNSPIMVAGMNLGAMFVTSVVYITVGVLVFSKLNLSLPISVPVLTVILTGMSVFVYRFLTEQREKQKLKGMFSTYVNPQVVETLIADPDKLKLGGDTMECSVLFSDVAGFTSISERLTAEQLVDLLNEYLTAMTDIVLQYGGTLDKFIGDAIVAIFGAPIPFEDHPAKAALAALDMKAKLIEIREDLKARYGELLKARIGVNTGEMIAGNMGSKNRFNYTVVGEMVDFGEHLESGGKNYGVELSMSEFTYRKGQGELLGRWMDILEIKGCERPVNIYEIVGKTSDPKDEKAWKAYRLFEEGAELFFTRKWDEAIAKFNAVFELIPDDPPSKTYIKRSEAFRSDPPGEDFDLLLKNASPPHIGPWFN